MSELREVIERQFKAHGLLSDAENENLSPETPVAEAVASSTEEKTACTPPEYPEEFASEFKNLPQKWQDFLCEREAENKKQITEYQAKLDAYNVVETLFGNRRDRLAQKGIKTFSQWLQGLAWLDAEMDARPAETLAAIAVVYGVDLRAAQQAQPAINPAIMARVCQLERNYNDLTSYLREMQNRNFNNTLNAFGRQTDREGNLLHPHFEQVKASICDLLKSGAVADIEAAYQSALWLNPSVRKELVQKQIDSEAKAAETAKKAVFALKGKAEKPERELTLRETIAKNMAKYVD
ncbi:MAG: hypothetical protein IKR92_02425 [Alphaproteobacteria bacterium]|nr:hypothetical protein [Alphaproteobacteria bacterium]